MNKLDTKLFLDVSTQSIKTYEQLFLVKYPFRKLDHVICPDFKYGGMENAGCITFSEVNLCKKLKMSVTEKVYFSIIVSHEV